MLRSTSSFGVAVRPDEQGVEPGEDRPVLLVDGAVGLVDDDQVEVAGTEQPLPAVGLVDQVHHRRVGGDVDAPVGDLLGHQVHGGDVRQVGLERSDGLVDQRGAVGQEQHPLDPARAHQLVDQRDRPCGSCPTPVAITSRALALLVGSNASPIARMARCW